MENRKSRIVPVRDWYMTFMYMNIPVIGWIYLLILALRKDKENDNREFMKSKKSDQNLQKLFCCIS